MPLVEVDLPDETIADLADLAARKRITRTEALVQAVRLTKVIADEAPDGVAITPMSARAMRRSSRLLAE